MFGQHVLAMQVAHVKVSQSPGVLVELIVEVQERLAQKPIVEVLALAAVPVAGVLKAVRNVEAQGSNVKV